MIDTLPPIVQRRYIKRPDLVTDVEQLGARITITRVYPGEACAVSRQVVAQWPRVGKDQHG